LNFVYIIRFSKDESNIRKTGKIELLTVKDYWQNMITGKIELLAIWNYWQNMITGKIELLAK
jgi:hypothetical protein